MVRRTSCSTARATGEFTNFTSDNSAAVLAGSGRRVGKSTDGAIGRIMWAADGKEHVMESRPYTAEDCAFA